MLTAISDRADFLAWVRAGLYERNWPWTTATRRYVGHSSSATSQLPS
ncbi:MAG: hypothetical protein AVDCRST_MAG75-1555 [uncultured Propionibacteriaceae bacterium]|uniref:Uncharacterized protein n=1 Tax=uncultured Propionibacteriaceae bacterium TaxID=257457 RepID=A0A6J4NKL9_9ACTN|nr:MAG: hypothetical protein AVDCRST_MAG75-1555 [uncultured Propionibacteriaceae bacterium]